MAEFLLELFSEEIPARMQDAARSDLARRLAEGLSEAGFPTPDVNAFATPRRLVAVIDDLPERQPDVNEERKGPKVGAPEKAVDGFLKSVGLSLDDVEIRDTPKGQTYFAVIERKGRPTADVLGDIVTGMITDFHWPKSMRWGTGRLRWVRPLHRVLCLFGGKPVSLDIEGVETGGNEVRGHRFMAPKPFSVKGFTDYREKLQKAFVLLETDERAQRIEEGARALVDKEGFQVLEDRALLREIAGLVEWPVPLVGRFDEAFLALPDEVLTSAMRGHQKYFSVTDPKSGRLAPRFVTVANLEAEDKGLEIVAGNERVLRARLSDARFFWDQDRKERLDARAGQLSDVVFHARLGSLGDKVARIQALARFLAPLTGATAQEAGRAAALAKCDLVTGMVYEFPELQGIMGRYYALEDKEPAAIADAVRDHYAPQGPGDRCPDQPVSTAVALADKIDTLVCFWRMDEKPTGSKDPFALRRAALGVIRIILENSLRLRLLDAFDEAAGSAGPIEGLAEKGGPWAEDLLGFFADRLKIHLRDQTIRHDLIDSVFALPGQDDLVRLVSQVEALSAFLQTEDGANLLSGVKRALNILRIEEKKDDTTFTGEADPALFEEEPERDLFEQMVRARGLVAEALEGEDFAAAMGALASLRGPVDRFFDSVTVNAKDTAIRRNRLLLLSQIRSSLDGVADFSRIEG